MFANTTMGAGYLALPYAFALNGVIQGTLICLFAAAASFFTASLLATDV